MAKFKFTLEVGCIDRKQVRRELERSKEKLEYFYPDASVSIREEKGVFDSEFYVKGINFPDTDECERRLRDWLDQIQEACY